MAITEGFHHHNQPSWPFYNVINSTLDESFLDNLSSADFSSSFTDLPPSDDDMDIIINSSVHHFSSMLTADPLPLSPATSDDGLAMITLSTEELLMNINDNNVSSPSPSHDEFSPMEVANSNFLPPPELNIPREEMELGNQVSVSHLLKAYGEAMEGGHSELAEVIMASVSEKVSPAGDSLERLAFNLSQDLHKESDYIKQEALKNFESAFRAFYQIFPYGRFAHFAANSALIDSIPPGVSTIHIVDFDIGEGVQWPPVIEALARQRKSVTVRLTALTWETEMETDLDEEEPAMWNFEDVKTRLLDHSRRVGLKLEIDETPIEDLGNEIKTRKKKKGGKQWYVFNCMIGLPHMRRSRSRKLIDEFLSTANESITDSAGIVTRGEGEAWESDLKGCSGLGSFFEGNMVYYRSVLESIELSFPELAEARMALECLFIAPYISSQGWIRRWAEMAEIVHSAAEKQGTEMEKWRVSKESLEEAKEMVKERQTAYRVTIGGEKENEMILRWNGTALVRVSSTWRN